MKASVALLLFLLSIATPAMAAPDSDEGALTRVVTGDGQPLFRTGLKVQPGDRFIDSANDVWSVTSLDRDRAIARRVARLVRPPGRRELSLLRRAVPRAAHAVTGAPLVDVAIYHTHSDESYINGDGLSNAPDKGGIYQVGAALATALSARGLRVIQRPDNHNPHDNGAYVRSRRTAQDLLETAEPALLLDLHRDAAPAAEYRLQAGATTLSSIMIVIGRSNPASETNLAFARMVKARADELTPGLIKGIFLGQGSFNQDLTPRSLLLEVGSQHTARSEAEAGAALLAVSLPVVLQDLAGPGAAAAAEEAVSWRSAGKLLLLSTLLAGLWMLVVHGGWRPAVERLLGRSRERR